MALHFVQQDAAGRQTRQFKSGQVDQRVFFVRAAAGWDQTSTEPDDETEIICAMTFKSWGVVLEARNDALEILPHPSLSTGESLSDGYMLQPSSERHSEVILLREKDTIRSPRVLDSWIVLTRGTPTQVQVTSSVSGEEQARKSIGIQNDANDSGDVTEDDDEDLDESVKLAQSVSRSTPLPSAARTEVVQETPTAPRSVLGPYNEPFSTAQTKIEEEIAIEVAVPEAKAKGSPASPATNSSTKRKKRISKAEKLAKQSTPATVSDDEDDTPSSKSPPSKRKRAQELPDTPITRTKKPRTNDPGPEEPRVAFSKSSIQIPSQFTKYLKRNRGTIAEVVDETCDVLCVADGSLHKTPKLLHSIALGIPIVTDKWLIDSTKHASPSSPFLPLAPYIPSCAAQEAEWGFDLASIWSKPHTSLFKNYTIVFTSALKAKYDNFAEIENVCRAAGADKVTVTKSTATYNTDTDHAIILALHEHDAKGAKRKFNKEFLPRAILRGALDLDSDEFRLPSGAGAEDDASDEEDPEPPRSRKKTARARKAA